MSDKNINDFNAANDFTKIICDICFGILTRAGPFLKENIYQELLIHELELLNHKTVREFVFSFNFKDSLNQQMIIGNNHSMRSDIEIPAIPLIIELKSSPTCTKHEHLWQLRNYLIHRKQQIGILVNFISKFDTKSSPHIQCDLIFHESDKFYLKTITSNCIGNFDTYFIQK